MTAPRSPRLLRWARPALWANLVAQIGIIVTGGAVRLTGSGLGCSTWPMCEPGEFTPVFHEATPLHAFIEFGNRTLTGVLGVIALVLALVIWKDTRRPTWYRRLGLVPLLGVVLQAGIGGVTVLLHLHPAVVGVHMLVSLALVAASAALLAARSPRAEGWVARPSSISGAHVLLGLGLALSVAGIVTTGSGPHSGDDEIAQRLMLDPVVVAKTHAWIVWAFVVVLLGVLWALVRRDHAPRAVTSTWLVLLGVTLAQGLLGYVQYFTQLPAVLVGAHMLGAALLVTALTWAYMDLRGFRAPTVGGTGTRTAP